MSVDGINAIISYIVVETLQDMRNGNQSRSATTAGITSRVGARHANRHKRVNGSPG